MCNPITDRKNPELTRLLIDNTPVAYIIMDEDYRIHYINENFLKLRKLDKSRTLGELCYNISNGGRPCAQCAVKSALAKGEKALIRRKDTLSDGTVRYLDDYAIPLGDIAGNGRSYILEIMVNRTQEILLRQQKDADYAEMLAILAALLEAKDAYTATHSQNVRKIAIRLAAAMGLADAEISEIAIAASLHDIGKVHVPREIINKPGKLTDEEFDIIKEHPLRSFEMLEKLSGFATAKNIARHHHERVDGRGYPDGLAGDEISIGARIVAVADTYDAMTSTRSYRKALSHEYAREEIGRVAGTQLDKTVVEAFLSMDFSADNNDDDIRPKSGRPKSHERTLNVRTVRSTPENINSDRFIESIDEALLVEKILDNTPCGYVFMDMNRTILFASDYYLEYMCLDESEILGKPCYTAGSPSRSPCKDCAVNKVLDGKSVQHMRRERQTKAGHRRYDLFAMPLHNSDGEPEYIIEIIIDRTEEALTHEIREQDFNTLIAMIGDLLRTEFSPAIMTPEVLALKARLGELLRRKAAAG